MPSPASSLVEFRRELHAHPELSHGEHRTAERVVAFLRPLGTYRIVEGVGGTGVVATFDSGMPGPVMPFRSELDALPIVEFGVVGHSSTVEGVSHKCGHDGHMAIVCGLARRLAVRRPARGVVHLLFQPAEETGTAAVLADPAFDAIRPFRLITPVHVRIGSVAYGVSAGDGEDFGLFSERFPCCMVLLGAGDDHDPIHNPNDDFPDDLIETGVRLFDSIVRQATDAEERTDVER